jgi:plastocyanin
MTSINRRDFGFAAVATLLLPVVAAAAEEAAADPLAVHIDNFVFQPALLTVKVGQTVTWTNRDDIPHTVVCAGKFRSKAMDTDGSFAFTFTAAGEYKYFCSLHPHMTGSIKVE